MAQYPAYWHNPYYSQARYFNNPSYNEAFVPSPPDSNAYSVGVPEGTIDLDAIWISYGYNWYSPYSYCSLIKDELDNFYYITCYKEQYTETRHVVFQKFNDDLNIDVNLEITPPSELITLMATTVYWFIRKVSDTVFDFIATSSNTSNDKWLHYRWTYGSSSMTYMGGGDVGVVNVGVVLLGNRLIGIRKDISTADWSISEAVYNLDSASLNINEVWSLNSGDFGQQDFDYIFALTGDYLYLCILWGTCTSYHECTGWLGAIYNVSDQSKLWWTTRVYGVDGSTNTSDVLEDTAVNVNAAHWCSMNNATYGVDPGTNELYFTAEWTKAHSTRWCDEEVGVPPWPGHPDYYKTRAGYVTLGPSGTPSWADYQEGSWNWNETGWEVPHGYIVGLAGAWADLFPCRNQPMSAVNHTDDGETYHYSIFNWKTRTHYLEDHPLISPDYFSSFPHPYFMARGQRNDTSPTLFHHFKYVDADEHYPYGHYHKIYFTLDGDEYTVDAVYSYEACPTGFMGKWPVTDAGGKAIIWGTPLIESEKGVYVQTVALQTSGSISGSRTEALSIGEPEKGDRTAWNIFEYPNLHSSEIYNDHYHYHSPEPDDIGQSPIWNGTKWLPGYVLTSGSGEYGWEDHWHLEEDVTDLLHNAKLIQDIWVDETPIDNEYLMYDLTSGSYITEALDSEKTILGLKELGFYTTGSLGTGGSFGGPMRLLSPWNGTIQKVILSAATPSYGDNIIVDVNKNGTTIFTDQDHRPVILSGSYGGETTDIDVVDFIINDVFTIDFDQVGTSGSPGSDVVTTIVVET